MTDVGPARRAIRTARYTRLCAALAELTSEDETPPEAYAVQQDSSGRVTFPDPEDPLARPIWRYLVVCRRGNVRHLSTRQTEYPDLTEGWEVEGAWDLETGERVR